MLELNKIYCGDCLKIMKDIDNNSIDAIITDPPYELGFMGKKWDISGIAYNVQMWKECYRILKPGAHLLSFGGSRTYHRMACAIEDAGFEIRDMIEWIYGSGFPKSLNIGKAIDKLQGNEREIVGTKRGQGNIPNDRGNWGLRPNEDVAIDKGNSPYEGWGTALKPAHEPICMARKPLSKKTVAENILKYGTGGINIDECRIGNEQMGGGTMPDLRDVGRMSKEAIGIDKLSFGQTSNAKRKEHPTYIGRFPANLIHNGSDEVMGLFPKTETHIGYHKKYNNEKSMFGLGGGKSNGSIGSAARFFYCAKASKSERDMGCEDLPEQEWGKDSLTAGIDRRNTSNKNKAKLTKYKPKNYHPTVKPIKLMEYLVKLVTIEGAAVLDPFCGSGSTLIACSNLGRNYIGIDNEIDYVEIANRRLANTYRQLELIK